MGTFHFNSGTLCFQWKERGSKFFRAEFQKWSGTRNVESMKAEREYLKRLFPSDHPDTVTCKSIWCLSCIDVYVVEVIKVP